MELQVLYEDNHIICVYKEAGILSQGDMRNIPSLYDIVRIYIKEKYGKQGNVFLGTVHRLDLLVSGVMVYARTSKAAARLHAAMLTGSFKKFYIAAVHKSRPFPEGWQKMEDTIEKVYGGSAVLREDHKNKSSGKSASLSCIKITESAKYRLLLIALHTGRKHQIRVQLSARNMPIVGDIKYGSSNRLRALMLHGIYLRFPHPVKGEYVELVSDIPERFYRFFPKESLSHKNIIDTIRTFIV